MRFSILAPVVLVTAWCSIAQSAILADYQFTGDVLTSFDTDADSVASAVSHK